MARKRDLHRADGVEQVDVNVSHDVGRDRERQRKQPRQRIASGKLIGGDQPGGAGAGDRGDDRDAGEQQSGVSERRRQHIGDQMRPDLGVAPPGDLQEADKRGEHEARYRQKKERCEKRRGAPHDPGERTRGCDVRGHVPDE